MTNEVIERELNRLYIVDSVKYKEECDDWKSKSYKIYRDTKGRHKVVEPTKDNSSAIYGNTFGNIFGNIFGGMK